jgi:hypothetical protein
MCVDQEIPVETDSLVAVAGKHVILGEIPGDVIGLTLARSRKFKTRWP